MLKYLLVLIVVNGGGVDHANVKAFNTMDACFEEREVLVDKIKRPIINYQAVCVLTDKII